VSIAYPKTEAWRAVALAFALTLPTACSETSPPEGAESDGEEVEAELAVPIERVVLYRSGIAYVERRGQVEGDSVTLQVQPDQINDMLTTLTVVVDGGENVASAIELPIERTVAQDLDSLPPQVRQQGGLHSLLNAFRGAEVTIEAGTGSARGRVVGTESLVNDDGNQIRHVTLMTDDGDLRQFRIDRIRRVEMANRSLEIGLERSLDVSLGEGDWKPVELTIQLSGEGPHEVFISYVVEMPTWKPTYRILVNDDDVHIQGWAVIDNVSGEDWSDVGLSLVAGTPISFQYDLHTPRFIPRPDLTERGFEGQANLLAPNVDSGVLALGAAASSTDSSRPGRTGARRRDRERSSNREGYFEGEDGDGEWAAMDPEPEPEVADQFRLSGDLLAESMGPSAASERLDNLFRYDVAHEISVDDRGSALVALLNEPVEGEDVLYFDPSAPTAGARNTPYRAVRLVNESDFTIERGPLSIYKDGAFVGQAIGPRIGEDELVFLPYSMDGRFRIDERRSTGEEGVRLVRIVNSVIYSEVQTISRRTYQVTNNATESARLYVRVPKRTNWSLRQPAEDSDGVIDQGGVWYVPLSLDGSASQELVIEEATTVTRSVEIWSDIAADTIGLYLSSADAVPELSETLQTVLDRRHRIAEIQIEIEGQRQRRQDVYRRMSEIRQNLEALGDSRASRDLRRTLEARLGTQEDEATELTVGIISLEEEEAELRALISTALLDLELDDE